MGSCKLEIKQDKSKIINLPFYTETIRLIKLYLSLQSNETPIMALKRFLELNCANKDKEDSIIQNRIAIEDPLYKNESLYSSSPLSSKPISDERKMLFLEELRILILTTVPQVEKSKRVRLNRYHMILHLIELSLNKEKTKYEKFKEFLNSNFALDKEDILGHACRGNYGEISMQFPGLTEALEEAHSLHGSTNKEISKWRKKYGINETLYKILFGKFRDFKNGYEEHCYNLLHEIPSKISDPMVDILEKNYNCFNNEEDYWLKLISLLTVKQGSAKEYEKSFECLFQLTFDTDFYTGLEFLSFSRKCNFYFSHLIDSIELNNLTVESLIIFACKNRLNKDIVVLKYATILQKKQDYDQLCRFILNNPVKDFPYSIEFITYFIDNYDKFRLFTKSTTHEDHTLDFIEKMSKVAMIDEEYLPSLFLSEHFPVFSQRVAAAISERSNIGERIIFELLRIVHETETSKGVALTHIRSALAKKLI